MDDVVDGEGVELTDAEAIEGRGNAIDELAEARLVVGGHQRSIGLALTLRTHAGIVALAPKGMNLLARARERPDVHSNADASSSGYAPATAPRPKRAFREGRLRRLLVAQSASEVCMPGAAVLSAFLRRSTEPALPPPEN